MVHILDLSTRGASAPELEASLGYILTMSQKHKQQQKTVVFERNVSGRQHIASMFILSKVIDLKTTTIQKTMFFFLDKLILRFREKKQETKLGR